MTVASCPSSQTSAFSPPVFPPTVVGPSPLWSFPRASSLRCTCPLAQQISLEGDLLSRLLLHPWPMLRFHFPRARRLVLCLSFCLLKLTFSPACARFSVLRPSLPPRSFLQKTDFLPRSLLKLIFPFGVSSRCPFLVLAVRFTQNAHLRNFLARYASALPHSFTVPPLRSISASGIHGVPQLYLAVFFF